MPSTDSPTTERYLVLLRREKAQEDARTLAGLAQVSIAAHAGGEGARSSVLQAHCAVVFDHIGVALVRCTPDSFAPIENAAASGDSGILAVEPERRVYALSESGASVPGPVLRVSRDDEAPWGVSAITADSSPYTGKGVRVAVLDTGLDLRHPDFAGRSVVSRSFIEGQPVQDGNGHGTHCAGVAAGPAAPVARPRYGVATAAQLYVGKVLSDEGSGGDGEILEGIDWAIANGCHIISMSLGSSVSPQQPYSSIFEEVAQRALAAGTLIVAAAGNDSRRPDHIAPVSHPANCPSILAVAAVDQKLSVAPFSSGGLQPDGGKVDIAGPGVDILSSWPAPRQYNVISGTSMATPFVAGAAALYAQADPSARGAALGAILTAKAKRLPHPIRDVGAGLVQAPQQSPAGA